jgi:hypothetical protein
MKIQIIYKWINQGNRAEDFQDIDPKIVLILDNASFHNRFDILAKISQELSNFIRLCCTNRKNGKLYLLTTMLQFKC